MPAPTLHRRQVLLAISQLVLAGSLAACSPGAEQQAAPVAAADTDPELLASVAYDLFPYPAVNAGIYVRIAERLLQAGNPVITNGLGQLRAAVGGMPWKDVAEEQRVAILAQLEGTPFFAAVRATSLEVLYRSPEVFAMVGYGGSAIEQGGYINRGFDDIDWLPAPPQ
jgi:hypothetical protein